MFECGFVVEIDECGSCKLGIGCASDVRPLASIFPSMQDLQ